jgi:hypothetical protein
LISSLVFDHYIYIHSILHHFFSGLCLMIQGCVNTFAKGNRCAGSCRKRLLIKSLASSDTYSGNFKSTAAIRLYVALLPLSVNLFAQTCLQKEEFRRGIQKPRLRATKYQQLRCGPCPRPSRVVGNQAFHIESFVAYFHWGCEPTSRNPTF